MDFAFDLSEIVFRSGVQIASSDILTFQNKIKKDKATQTCSQRMQSKGIDQPSYHPDLLAIDLSWQRTLELASRTPPHPQNKQHAVNGGNITYLTTSSRQDTVLANTLPHYESHGHDKHSVVIMTIGYTTPTYLNLQTDSRQTWTRSFSYCIGEYVYNALYPATIDEAPKILDKAPLESTRQSLNILDKGQHTTRTPHYYQQPLLSSLLR